MRLPFMLPSILDLDGRGHIRPRLDDVFVVLERGLGLTLRSFQSRAAVAAFQY